MTIWNKITPDSQNHDAAGLFTFFVDRPKKARSLHMTEMKCYLPFSSFDIRIIFPSPPFQRGVIEVKSREYSQND